MATLAMRSALWAAMAAAAGAACAGGSCAAGGVDNMLLQFGAKQTKSDAKPTCPLTEQGRSFGNVQTSQIGECSGLAASRRNPGKYWVNNDSGAGPRLYAIDRFGKHVARLWVEGSDARDWEDIAAGPGPRQGTEYIYIADLGDNHRSRGSVQIYRVEDPELAEGRDRNSDVVVRAERFEIRYPDGAHDCEALFIDQGETARQLGTEGRVYIITKGDGSDGRPGWRGGDIYHVDLPEHSAQLQFTHGGHLPLAWVTGADLSPSGSLLAVRTYSEVRMWPRKAGATVEASLAASGGCTVSSRDERQGEAIAFGARGDHYVTVSEGSYPAVWYFGLSPTFRQSVMGQLAQ